MEDFGGKLRQARERRGVSLRQIAASTKISAAALEALERNDVSKLPGGIFSRAFVRSYAVEVGLDPDETVREFVERFDREPPSSAEQTAATIPEHELTFQEEQRRAARTLAIAVVVLVVAIAVAVFAWRARHNRAIPPPAPAAAMAEPAPLPPDVHPTVSAIPAPDPGAPSAATAAAAPLTLDIHPTSECRVALTIDGKRLFARVMRPGEHESHTVDHEAIVEIDNAGAFAFSLNGRAGKSVGDPGQARTLTLTPANATEFVK